MQQSQQMIYLQSASCQHGSQQHRLLAYMYVSTSPHSLHAQHVTPASRPIGSINHLAQPNQIPRPPPGALGTSAWTAALGGAAATAPFPSPPPVGCVLVPTHRSIALPTCFHKHVFAGTSPGKPYSSIVRQRRQAHVNTHPSCCRSPPTEPSCCCWTAAAGDRPAMQDHRTPRGQGPGSACSMRPHAPPKRTANTPAQGTAKRTANTPAVDPPSCHWMAIHQRL
jgi:hypothetical protein